MILVLHQINLNPRIKKLLKLKNYQYIMETLSILTFFLLVITFFIRGKNDFGLKPKSKINDSI